MKRTLSVTLIVGGVLFVICTLLLGRQQSILVAEEAQAVAERARALAEAPPPVSLPGKQGGAGAPNESGGASLLPVDTTLNRLETDSDLVPSRRLPLPMAPAHPRDDQDAAMDRQAKQLAANVRDADEPAKSKFRAELEKLTEKHFEYRQRRRSAEIADMAERVDKLRVAHHRRQENKPDILKRRLADLLDENNELKWDDTSAKPTANIPVATPKPVPQPQLPKLDGEWLVTLPAGFEFVGKIEKQPEGCWSFTEMRNLSGYYQLEGEKLKGVTTDPKEPREYEWLILNDNVMVLTRAPQNIGSDYRGATLRRGAKPKSSLERSQLSPNTFDLPARLENPDARQAGSSREQ